MSSLVDNTHNTHDAYNAHNAHNAKLIEKRNNVLSFCTNDKPKKYVFINKEHIQPYPKLIDIVLDGKYSSKGFCVFPGIEYSDLVLLSQFLGSIKNFRQFVSNKNTEYVLTTLISICKTYEMNDLLEYLQFYNLAYKNRTSKSAIGDFGDITICLDVGQAAEKVKLSGTMPIINQYIEIYSDNKMLWKNGIHRQSFHKASDNTDAIYKLEPRVISCGGQPNHVENAIFKLSPLMNQIRANLPVDLRFSNFDFNYKSNIVKLNMTVCDA